MEHAARMLTLLTVASLSFLLVEVSSAAESDIPKSSSTLPAPLPKSMPRPEGNGEAMPIDWPSVLELARASNLEIALAIEKVHEAHVKLALAKRQWVPSLKVGVAWGHHDGRIQDVPGNIIDTSKSWLGSGGYLSATVDPQKIAVDVLRGKQLVQARSGQLDGATRQALQDASLAYLDLVRAQAGAAISQEITQLIGELVNRSKQLLNQGVGTQVDVLRNRAQFQSQLQALHQAGEGQLAASARLVQLLNLEPGTRLFAADEHLAPVVLVDQNRPEDELIEQALDQGPGLAEVASLLAALEEQERTLRRIRSLPTVEFEAGEGAFGGGLGGRYDDFDSRNQVGVNLYWDIMKLVGTRQTRQLFNSQRQQATLKHEQLHSQLAAGVVVSLTRARKAEERIKLAESEIDFAIRSYELSHARLLAAETVSFEVVQAIAALGLARRNYLEAVTDFNRAQIQLQYLIGFTPGLEPPAASKAPQEAGGEQLMKPVPQSGAAASVDTMLQAEEVPVDEIIDLLSDAEARIDAEAIDLVVEEDDQAAAESAPRIPSQTFLSRLRGFLGPR